MRVGSTSQLLDRDKEPFRDTGYMLEALAFQMLFEGTYRRIRKYEG